MTLRLLTEHHLEILNLKGGCTGSSEITLVKMPHFWKSHVPAHFQKLILQTCWKLIFHSIGKVPLNFPCTYRRVKQPLQRQIQDFLIGGSDLQMRFDILVLPDYLFTFADFSENSPCK